MIGMYKIICNQPGLEGAREIKASDNEAEIKELFNALRQNMDGHFHIKERGPNKFTVIEVAAEYTLIKV